MKLCHFASVLKICVLGMIFFGVPVTWAGDAALDEQRLLWRSVANAEPAKVTSAAQPHDFMESGMDARILLEPQTSPLLKEQILDAYSYYSFPETYRRWATIATIHDASLKVLDSEASPRVRIKAYRYALMAENPYPLAVKYDICISLELQKRLDAEPNKSINELITGLITALQSPDEKVRNDKWRYLWMGRAGSNAPDQQLRCRNTLIEDWIVKYPALAADPLNAADFKKLLDRFMAEDDSVEQVSMKQKPAAPLLKEGTPLQKNLTIQTLYEERFEAKDWPSDCLDALVKIVDDANAPVENKRGALACLVYSPPRGQDCRCCQKRSIGGLPCRRDSMAVDCRA